jgi:hypothetical protein
MTEPNLLPLNRLMLFVFLCYFYKGHGFEEKWWIKNVWLNVGRCVWMWICRYEWMQYMYIDIDRKFLCGFVWNVYKSKNELNTYVWNM